MSEKNKNIPASIHARLTNEAKKLGRPFGEVLQYYGMERFLYRIFQTHYADDFILKGGLLFYSWGIPLRRSTRDIDFLGFTQNRKEVIQQVITDSFSQSIPEDGVNFDLTTLAVEITQVDADRTGIRANFKGYLGNAQMNIQIDFGFSDEITSAPVLTNYPPLLPGMTGPQIRSYPVESVIAEKFHAIQRYADLPSRWKDWYDLWLISESFELDDLSLQKAIAKTFEKRVTELPIGRPISLTSDFATKNQQGWSAFLKRSNLQNNEINDLSVLVEKIWVFLAWPLQGLTPPNQHTGSKRWMPGERKWM